MIDFLELKHEMNDFLDSIIEEQKETAVPLVTPQEAREALASLGKAEKGNAIKLGGEIYDIEDWYIHHKPTIRRLLEERAGAKSMDVSSLSDDDLAKWIISISI